MNTSKFFENLKRYLAVLVFFTAINLITSPNNLWVVWPALGMGIALLKDMLDLTTSKRCG
ncbi:2TM domain-containing protein [Pseudoalteromonas sp. MMG006]|uniref:2TM domain-containing protein n=1 Tax=Pseudoalteromonas sp. MMG006 TaxID=2822683 RepID=UPI001B368559|nr:2TM domain-containing protein [Pseudoalteromonas sp. MMG006]MBQ4798127.1 2TM domain-containing protein [Pseudoalteromonas sp. MMG006]